MNAGAPSSELVGRQVRLAGGRLRLAASRRSEKLPLTTGRPHLACEPGLLRGPRRRTGESHEAEPGAELQTSSAEIKPERSAAQRVAYNRPGTLNTLAAADHPRLGLP